MSLNNVKVVKKKMGQKKNLTCKKSLWQSISLHIVH